MALTNAERSARYYARVRERLGRLADMEDELAVLRVERDQLARQVAFFDEKLEAVRGDVCRRCGRPCAYCKRDTLVEEDIPQ